MNRPLVLLYSAACPLICQIGAPCISGWGPSIGKTRSRLGSSVGGRGLEASRSKFFQIRSKIGYNLGNERTPMTKFAAILALTIWMFSLAPAFAQGLTEYLGTTGKSAGQAQGLSSMGSAIGNQFHGTGKAIDSGNTTPSHDSDSEEQNQTVDSARSSDSRQVKVPVKRVPDWQKPDPIDYTHNPNLGY